MSDIRFINITKADASPTPTTNDIRFNPATHDVEKVSGANLVTQKVAKALLSSVGRSTFVPAYGTELFSLRFADGSSTRTQQLIADTIVYAIAFVEGVETSELNAERIQSIDDIVIEPLPEQGGIVVTVTLTLRDGTQISQSVVNS